MERLKLMHKQITAMNICYQRYSFDYFLNSVERMGIESIEFWGAPPHFNQDLATSNEITRIRKKIADHKLSIACFTPLQNQFTANIAASDKTFREYSISRLSRAIRIAAELGTHQILLTSGRGLFDRPMEEAWSYSMDSLDKLAQVANKEGVTIVLEPLRQDETNLVTSMPLLKKALTEVNSPALKGMADVNPMYNMEESLNDYFLTFGTDLRHIHLVDGKPNGHLALGEGILPITQYIEDIIKNGYNNYITLELTSPDYFVLPEKPMRKSLDMLSSYIEQ